MEKDKLGEECPACGVSSKVFEPYKDRMSEKRRKLLDLDLHPIAVHFPQTIAVFIMQFVFLTIVLPHFKITEISAFVVFLSVLLPFSVIGAFVSGVIDGKLRFKKLGTIALRRKIIIGSGMIVSSVVVAFIAIKYDYTLSTKIALFVSSVVTLALAISLAVTGKKLMYAEMPG
jgi:uncharacterized membrane protein